MRRAILMLPLLAGCLYSEYTPGTLAVGPNTRTYGCVDLLVIPEWSEETPPGGQMIDVELGNRCDHGVPTNFNALRVHVTREGRSGEIPAHPYDPHGEIRYARLPASTHIHERIIWFPTDQGCTVPIERVCVDVDGLVPGTESATNICFRRNGDERIGEWGVEP
jgi:hypothetical protein